MNSSDDIQQSSSFLLHRFFVLHEVPPSFSCYVRKLFHPLRSENPSPVTLGDPRCFPQCRPGHDRRPSRNVNVGAQGAVRHVAGPAAEACGVGAKAKEVQCFWTGSWRCWVFWMYLVSFWGLLVLS